MLKISLKSKLNERCRLLLNMVSFKANKTKVGTGIKRGELD